MPKIVSRANPQNKKTSAQLKTFVSTLARRSIIELKTVSLDREFDSRADSVEFMVFN
jgi:hypothetical protein